MPSIIKNVKGTKDILPQDSLNWDKLEQTLKKIAISYGFNEIRTPIFEKTELFVRSVGEETDIVNKEMYTWEDLNGESLTLRPESTAPIIRSYIQNQLWKIEPLTKVFYIDSLFRRERPQKGRQRQFHQFGVEAIGSAYPEQDAEIIAMAFYILNIFNIENLRVEINSIGALEDRNIFIKELKKYLKPHLAKLSELSKKRFNTNALRILDSKSEKDIAIIKNAPSILDFINKSDLDHFESVKKMLDAFAIPYIVSPSLVRGLDYYNKTTFEIKSDLLGSQNTICGGGRYDSLIQDLGGESIPAVGFAMGIERLMLLSSNSNNNTQNADVYIINAEEQVITYSLSLATQLRNKLNLNVITESLRRSMKSQLRYANKINAKYVLIIGENEMKSNSVILKNMSSGSQKQVQIEKLSDEFK